ncbi:MAG TPA: HlyD family efflux transporter periplasmic adaptor subunit [Mycobacteriales bacterium]
MSAAVILAAAGIGAYASTNGPSTAYRTATVERATVDKTLVETGTATPETSVAASFADKGTVSSVAVQPGQRVTAGQPLAQLDTVTLDASLAAAQATAAQDALVLADAENGQLVSAGGNGSGGSFGGTTTAEDSPAGVSSAAISTATSGHATPATSPGRGAGTGSTSLTGLQQQVVDGQKTLDGDLAHAGALLTAAESACPTDTGSRGSPSPGPSSGTSTTASASPSAAPSASPSPSPSPSGTTVDPADCLQAESQLLGAQRTVAQDETQLGTAEQALTSALDAAQTALSTSAGSGQGGRSDTTTGRSGATTGAGATPTAADIAADQAALDASDAAVAVAQQNLAMATLTSPISGTVLSVGFAVGASASGQSVVVANPEAYVFDTTVPVTSYPEVKEGQAVAIVPDGTSTTVHGTVVRIGAAPNSSGDYPVVVGVGVVPPNVRSGSTASLTITLAATHAGLTVPTSALTTVGRRTIVRTLSGGVVTPVPVTVVTMGAVRSLVTGALSVGERVVLADLHTPVPASNSTTVRGAGGLGGGLGASLGGRTTGLGGSGFRGGRAG